MRTKKLAVSVASLVLTLRQLAMNKALIRMVELCLRKVPTITRSRPQEDEQQA